MLIYFADSTVSLLYHLSLKWCCWK